ncbi:MAG: cell wall-binding repeat-containing protein [Firmicutes bacterium]|nr:cell wall-binding repeat-containing protein [Alicyclobacillaceae bacterium]MCL6498165.1 cell wall-binding repeat-containing protein [Bacillota bacterium]
MSKQRLKARSKLGILAAAGLMAWTLAPMGSVFAANAPQETTLGGADRMATAIQIANAEYPNGPTNGSVILASGADANLIDSVTAAPLAKALGAPILLTQDANTIGSETMSYLTSHAISKVYLIGAAANSNIESQLPTGVTTVTLTGADRYATAAAIANQLAQVENKSSFSTVYVASGDDADLSDALAIAPWAAANGDPVLLAAPGQTSLPSSEASLITGQSSQTPVVVGAATGYNLTFPGDATPETIGSSSNSNYANAVAIAQKMAPSSGYTTIDIANDSSTELDTEANGTVSYHLVDAITGGPLAAMQGAPILFTNGATVTPSLQSFLSSSLVKGVTQVNVFGGTASIPSSTVTQIVNTIAGVVTPTPTTTSGNLSLIQISGQSFGQGTAANPAVAVGGTPMTLSTTLTDANGNPVPGVDVDLYFILNTTPPTSVTSNGQALAEGSDQNGTYFAVPTNAEGVAAAQLSESAGSSLADVAHYVGPYTANGVQINTPPVYLEFVGSNQAALSPEQTTPPQSFAAGSPGNSAGGVVPLVFTLPPLNGQAPVNVSATFTVSGYGNSASAAQEAYFANADGSTLATLSNCNTTAATYQPVPNGPIYSFECTGSETVNTNSNGQAVAYVASTSSGAFVTVSASATDGGGTFSGTTWFGWGTAGIPNHTINYGVSGVTGTYNPNSSVQNGVIGSEEVYTAQVGTDVTFYGQAFDANNNPVPNAQLFVVAGGNDNNTDAMVVNGQSKPFPYVLSAPQILQSDGQPYSSLPPVNGLNNQVAASPSYGFTIAANGAGQFNFTVTNTTATLTTNPNTNILSQPNDYLVYAVENGTIQSGPGPGGTMFTNNGDVPAIDWQVSGNVTSIGVAGVPSIKSTDTSVSGIEAPATPSSYIGTDQTPSLATLYIEGFSGGAAYPTSSTASSTGATETFTVQASGNASVYSVDGVPISSTFEVNKSVQIGVTFSGGSSGTYTVTVNGSTTGANGASYSTWLQQNVGTYGPVLEIGVADTTSESPTVTITSGSVSATANLTFGATSATQLGAASPSSVNLSAGQTSAPITITVQDANGNPVPNTTVNFTYSNMPDLWITAINGVTLQLEEPNGSTTQEEPTPLPLFNPAEIPTTTTGVYKSIPPLGYNSVVIPGVVDAANGVISVQTNSNGQVQLTLSDGVSAYYTGSPVVPNTNTPGPAQFGSDLSVLNSADSGTAVFWFLPVGTSNAPSNLVNGSPGTNGAIVLSMNPPATLTVNGQQITVTQEGTVTWQG